MLGRLLTSILFVAGVVVLGGAFPLEFAGATAILTFAVSVSLEQGRLRNEWSFYTGRVPDRSSNDIISLWALISAIAKSVFTGFIALFTFPIFNEYHEPGIIPYTKIERSTRGWDLTNLQEPIRLYVAVAFSVIVLLGALYIRHRTHQKRWGENAYNWAFFRISTVLGISYSCITYAIFRRNDLEVKPSDLSEIYSKLRGVLNSSTDYGALVHTVSKVDEVMYKVTFQVVHEFIQFPNFIEAIFAILISSDILQGIVLSVYIFVAAKIMGPLENRAN